MFDFIKNNFDVLMSIVIFLLVFSWAYCGEGGTRDNKTWLGRFGFPIAFGAIVLVAIWGMGLITDYSERTKCNDLPAGEGMMLHKRCYKKVDGPVYVSADSDVIKRNIE